MGPSPKFHAKWDILLGERHQHQSPDGKNGYADGYITATRDALDPNPVFWSGKVNPDGHPLLYNQTTDGTIGITILDFNGGAWSPDGNSVWGSWVQDCGVNIATSPGCTSRYPAINPADPENGFAGRLVWPPTHHPKPLSGCTRDSTAAQRVQLAVEPFVNAGRELSAEGRRWFGYRARRRRRKGWR